MKKIIFLFLSFALFLFANEDIKKLKDNTDFTSYNLCKKFLDDFFSKAKTDNV